MLDAGNPLTEEDFEILQQNQTSTGKIILAANKCDLPAAWTREDLPGDPLSSTLLHVSAKFGKGLDELKQAMTSLTGSCDIPGDNGLITQLRHKLALEKAQTNLQAALAGLQANQSPEFTAFELTEALNALDEITGRKIQDEVLLTIFSSFCIGK